MPDVQYIKHIGIDTWESALERGIVFVHDEIDDTGAYRVIEEISYAATHGLSPIRLVITTGGGSVFDGLAIYDYARSIINEGIEVYTFSLGWTASMGAVLLQAGSKRFMHENAWLMIHEVSGFSPGKTSDLVDEAKLLKRLEDESLIPILTERSTLSSEQLKKKWKRRDWWLSSRECLNLGFCDDIVKSL